MRTLLNRILLTPLLIFISMGIILAQAPQKFSYQAVIRDADNEILANVTIRTQISIIQGSEQGNIVYSEIQTPTTNANGLFTIQIGDGSSPMGDFSGIDWSAGPYFIKTETDPFGGVNYTITGINQLLSVPYALYAESSGNAGMGPEGPEGPEGKSAYEVWLQAGNTGSETDFLNSLVGADGVEGPQGSQGIEGKSAYQVWLEAGNSGSETDFLNSLAGVDGTPGADGLPGKSAYQLWLEQGNTGSEADFLASSTGPAGLDGKSAYQIWLDDGNIGTETDFLNSLVGVNGVDGKSAYQIWLDEGNVGTEADFLNSLIGSTGTDGKSAYQVWLDEGNVGSEMDFLNSLIGATGAEGKSAYQIWLDEGNIGTEADFLASLEGPQGPAGSVTQRVIGESYGGGIVFYVYDNGQHGLIAATVDQSSGARWSQVDNNTRATGDGIGAGEMNTLIIIAKELSADPDDFAAALCANYSVTVDGVTYGDWYLPSKHELNLLYLQKGVVGLPNQAYWSSTEANSGQAWRQVFGDGTQNTPNKSAPSNVRAIRAF